VVVAGVERDVRQADVRLGEPVEDVTEADEPCVRLRADADLLAEARDQACHGEPGFLAQHAHAKIAAAALDLCRPPSDRGGSGLTVTGRRPRGWWPAGRSCGLSRERGGGAVSAAGSRAVSQRSTRAKRRATAAVAAQRAASSRVSGRTSYASIVSSPRS